MLCCGYTLTDFPISIRLTSLALWQSNDCPSASKATLMNMDKYFMWIHYEWLHNHSKAKHNKTVCIFLGIYCMYCSVLPKVSLAPILRTSGSWNLPFRMEDSFFRNFNNYYALLIHVFDGCSNRFDPCYHFNLVCCCLNPVLISHKRYRSLKPIWLDIEMLVPLFLKINQCCRDACQISEQLEDSKG